MADRHPTNRREEILDTALRLFAEHGADGTSMAALADAVGMTKGSLYHHFSGKAEILEAVLDDSKLSGSDVRAALSASDAPLADRLARIAASFLHMMRSRPYWSLAMLRESLGSPRDPSMARVKERFHGLLQGRIDALGQCLAEEWGVAESDAQVGHHAAMGFFHALNSYWLLEAHIKNEVPSEEESEDYARFIACRFAAPPQSTVVHAEEGVGL